MVMVMCKQKILPIMAPWKKMDGTQNRLREVNPSLHLLNQETGYFRGVVRLISYIKFPDQSFETWLYPTQSVNIGFEGHLDRPDEWTFHDLDVDYDRPVYPTHWQGVEDIRFLSSSQLVASVPELNADGEPSLFLITYRENTLSHFIPLPRFQHVEKNWMPFEDGKKFIYQIQPLRVYDTESGTLSDPLFLNGAPPGIDESHGSTNGVPWDQGWLFLIHHGHQHRFFHLKNAGENPVFSTSFVLFATSHIEFICSLSHHHGLLWLSAGVNDDNAYLIAILPTDISWC